MARDVEVIVNEGQAMGLHLNTAKCELIHKSVRSVSHPLLANFKQTDLTNMSMLGPPLMPGPEMDRKFGRMLRGSVDSNPASGVDRDA